MKGVNREKISLYLDKTQTGALRILSDVTRVNMAVFIREGVDLVLAKYAKEFKKTKKGGGIMAVLAECPVCHRKQSAKNKNCKCGEDLDKAKRSKRVLFWIDDWVPGNGKQLRTHMGTSIEEVRDANEKRRT